MFTLSSIHNKAKQTLTETKGILFLALFPVITNGLVHVFSDTSTTLERVLEIAQYSPNYLDFFISTLSFPIVYKLLISLTSLSLSYTLFLIVHKKKSTTSVKDAFSIFEHPEWKTFVAVFAMKHLFLLLWKLLLFVGLILFFLSTFVTASTVVALNQTATPSTLLIHQLSLGMIGIGGGLLLTGIGCAIYLPQRYAYSMVENLFFSQLETGTYNGARPLLKKSRQLMKGYKWKRCLLDLTFIGWFLLSFLTLGMSDCFVLPYYHSAHIHFYRMILDEKKRIGT